jgi:chromosome segregation ATPase
MDSYFEQLENADNKYNNVNKIFIKYFERNTLLFRPYIENTVSSIKNKEKDKIKQVLKEYNDLQSQYEDLANKIDIYRKIADDNKFQENKIIEIEKSIDNKNIDIKTMKNKENQIEKEVSRLKIDNKEIEKNLKNKDGELNNAKNKITKMEKENAKLKEDGDKLQNTIKQ